MSSLPSNAPPTLPVAHLVLPFAACESEHWRPALQALPASSTAQLSALLRGMQLRSREATGPGSERTLSAPHERLLAQEQGWAGLPDGLLPWAALEAGELAQPGTAWGWVTLCHWAMGREHATLSDPAALNVTPEESQALLSAMRPFFESDGIQLHPLTPGRWLAEGEALAQPTASLDRVLGRNVDPWLPSASGARVLRRLQNEMQMLLYTHPVNEARQAVRQLTVNSVWFSGTGRPAPATVPADVQVVRSLAQAALAEDWAAYAQAWAELDRQEIAALLQRQRAGQCVRLSLCGERGSLTLESARPSLWSRLNPWRGQPRWPDLLEGL